MNFAQAMYHMGAGHKIRRQKWVSGRSMENSKEESKVLYFAYVPGEAHVDYNWPDTYQIIMLYETGAERGYEIRADDHNADDWQTWNGSKWISDWERT